MVKEAELKQAKGGNNPHVHQQIMDFKKSGYVIHTAVYKTGNW